MGSKPGERDRAERRAATWAASVPSSVAPLLRPLPLRDLRREEEEREREGELEAEDMDDEDERSVLGRLWARDLLPERDFPPEARE